MFEWQKHTQASIEVPHYQELLDFINLCAQASEASISEPGKKVPKGEVRPSKKNFSSVASFAASTDTVTNHCVLCKTDKHPLYSCSKFKSLSHEQKTSTLKDNHLCMNCLGAHFVRQCKSIHRCKRCQKPHHSLLYVDAPNNPPPTSLMTVPSLPPALLPISSNSTVTNPVTSHAATGLKTDSLLMTCRVLVGAPDG